MTTVTVEEETIDVTVVEDVITLNVSGGASPNSVAAVASDLSDHEALSTTAHGGIVADSDSRLTDARMPTDHAASHATGQSDAIAAADIGAEQTGTASALVAAHAAAMYSETHAIPNISPLYTADINAVLQVLTDGGIVTNNVVGFTVADLFDVDLSAGNIDGSSAALGTRSTGVTGSISGGNYVLSGAADDSLWYDETVTRAAGQCVVFTPTITDATTTIEFGFDTDQAGALAANAIRMASDLLKPYDGGVAGPNIFVPSDATEYSLAVCLLTAGAAYFLDGNLLYKGGTNATATLYAGIANTDATGTIDNVKASSTLWAHTPIAADTGTSADVAGTYYTDGGTLTGIEAGGDGEPWNGATWSNGVDGATNTPGLGAELVTNGGFESWTSSTDADNWGEAISGTSTINQESVDVDSGAFAMRFDVDASNSNVQFSQSDPVSAGDWVNVTLAHKASVSGKTWKLSAGFVPGLTKYFFPTTTYATSEFVGRGEFAAATPLTIARHTSTSSNIYVDSISVKQIPTADLFRSISDADTPYVYASASWIIESDTQAGLVVCLDDADTPANFIIAYHDDTNVIVEKCVGGTYTTLGSTAATYDADEPLVVRTLPSGNDMSVWVWYDGAYIANYTLDETTDAAIIAGTLHGLFSTHADNDCSDVTIYAATGHSLPGA